jgi:hypothetical protein
MSFIKSNYLSVASGHIDSLINYVVDVKPYHVKLSAIVEQYLFEDTVRVKVTEDHKILAFLGADILPSGPTTPGVRTRRSSSWFRDTISDGQRRTWPAPLTSVNKLASHASQEKFTCGVDDDFQIPGIGPGVFNQRRWDGPGITNVSKNGIHQQDSVDYFLSHGVYSFVTHPGQRWKELNVAHVSAYSENPGALLYLDVAKSFGTIKNITGGNYEEWTLKCIEDDVGIFSISGSTSGIIGTVTYGSSFSHALISFDFTATPGDLVGPFFSDGLSDSNDDDQGLTDPNYYSSQNIFTLTPFNKITVASNAPAESWSLIKTNPIVSHTAPVFISSVPRTDTPAIEIHTRSLDRANEDATWTVTFGNQNSYVVKKSTFNEELSWIENLKNGCSFKNNEIHFTLLTTTTGFHPGDSFSFSTNARVENYLVFGSVSGFQANAKIGEWYWNGKIGFKIPKLDYVVKVSNTTIITSASALPNSWNTVVSNNQILRSISFNDGLFLTAGENSIVGASSTGINWTSDIHSVFTPASPNSILTVVGPNGSIGTSNDGVTWYKQESHTSKNLNGVIQIPNLLTIFPTLPPTPPGTLNCIIAVGDSGTILTSVNGIGWADQNSGTDQHLNGIAYSNVSIIAVGSNGTIVKSTDRLTWTPVNSTVTANLRSIIYEPTTDTFIIVGDSGTILKSIDGGNTWLAKGEASLSAFDFSSVAFGNGQYVAVGPSGAIISSLDNGESWPSPQFGRRLNSIAYGQGMWVAVGGKSDENQYVVPLKTIHSIAEPSVYTVTFTSPTTATVVNNIYGYRAGLIPDTDWEDEFVSFRLQTIPGQFTYQSGDIVKIYLAPKYVYSASNWYDEANYDSAPYDSGVIDLETTLLFNAEVFPLYHSHGSVIFKSCAVNSKIVIDKAFTDLIRFRIVGASSNHPELAAVEDWIPLEFRYYDRLINGVPTSTAHFSDLTTYIEAYLCSDPNVKVFSVSQPRFEKTNRNASATMTFDPVFFAKYMQVKAKYSVLYLPDESYGQRLRVKMTENLKTYARIRLNFNDISLIKIDDSPIKHFHIVGDIDFIESVDIHFIEGGALPIDGGYDVFPYDVFQYDDSIHNGVISGMVELSPGVYDWTDNPADWIMPKPTLSPSIFIEETPDDESASSSFVEGLFIAERIVGQPGIIDKLNVHYDVNLNTSGLLINQLANEYVITHNGPPSSPTLIVESLDNLGVYGNPLPNMHPYSQIPTAISLKAFTFVLPSGFTAPFRLTVA